MNAHEHTHPCRKCQKETPCTGALERNHDGYPEVVCASYHFPNGRINEDFVCEECHDGDPEWVCINCGHTFLVERREENRSVPFALCCPSCGSKRVELEQPQ